MKDAPHIGEYLFGDAPLEAYLDEGEKELLKLDAGWAKAAYHYRTGMHLGHGMRQFRARSLLLIHQELEVWEKRFSEGNTLAILHAINICAEENLPLPTWLARAYLNAIDGFLSIDGTVHSLDEVFTDPSRGLETIKKYAARKIDLKVGASLWTRAWKVAIADPEIRGLDAAIDRVLTQQNWGVKKTKARKLIEMIDKNQSELVPTHQCFSRFFELRRKL